MLFKRKKKPIEHVGAKKFDGKINLIEIVKNGLITYHFSRPQIVELELDNNDIINLINGLTKSEPDELEDISNTNSKNEIYLNGINVNQINSNYLKQHVIVVEKDLTQLDINDNLELNAIIKDIECLSPEEKSVLNNIYNINPSVVIFNEFKLDLLTKQYEQLKNVLLNLFCDAIILFIKQK